MAIIMYQKVTIRIVMFVYDNMIPHEAILTEAVMLLVGCKSLRLQCCTLLILETTPLIQKFIVIKKLFYPFIPKIVLLLIF